VNSGLTLIKRQTSPLSAQNPASCGGSESPRLVSGFGSQFKQTKVPVILFETSGKTRFETSERWGELSPAWACIADEARRKRGPATSEAKGRIRKRSAAAYARTG